MCIRDRHISCGMQHMALISTCGEMFAWGDASNGQLDCVEKGKGCIMIPQKVELPDNTPIAAARMAACGDSHTCVSVSYTHLRAHETPEHLVCRLLLEKKKK
eukprot:TRINITY_DN14542_c0_g1_i2.p2 TRINITY_DN14542_c0_g1~~TRINITY_DN14542_c0_g1_i2.p2  ORF type:complete len:102 (-),score=35.16 TRINITY_DN14542_c0_g1_i2:114-419(-)